MFRGMMLRRSLLKVGVMFLVLALASVAAMLSRSSDRALAATQGPVAEFSFDEGEEAGATVEDLSEEGNDATLEGAKRTTHGRYGGALEFSGEESCATVPTSESLQLDEEFTLEAWVRPSGTPTADPIFFKESEGTYSYAMSVGFGNEGQPEGRADGEQVLDPHTIEPDVWTHIAFTYDGATLRLYVDGELVESEHVGELHLASEGPLYIGCDPPAWGDHFRGRIDEARIYERVLGAGEIDSDMETPIATPKAGPVAEYSFDGLAEGAETVEDHSGHEHTATIHGAKPVPNGRYGGAMEFKEGEYLSVPSSPELDLTEEFTLEAWIHPETKHEFDDILSKETTEVKDPSHAAYLMADHHGQFATYYGEYENAYYSPGEEIPTHTWTHVAVVDDGARIHLFLNGQEVESGPAFPIISTEGGELRIGSSRTLGEENDFIGRIDEVRIYGRALNQAEVGTDMETPIQTPKAGPVAAYSFDEGEIGTEGGTVEDVSENEHTATLEGGATRVKGQYGDALHFREEGDCATVPASPELDLSEEFTLEAWVWSEGGLYEDPIVVREAGGKGVFGIGIGSREEGEAEGFIGEGKSSKAAIGGGEVVRENSWVHIATTYDGSKLRLYVDGELVATKSATTPPTTGEGSLRIGCDGPDGPFGGRIDEVRLYGRALNGPEVDSDMESPLQTPKATPVASYSFDEKNEETAADTSGDGHTATVEGAKWTERGKYGGAYEFKASEEDVLKIPASEELDFDEEFTLEAWVRPSGQDNHDAPLIDKQEGSGHGYFLYEGGSVSDRPYGAANEEQEFIHAEDPLPANTWSHVALTFSGNRTYLYVNGELVDNGAAEPTVTKEGELEIGGSTDTSDYFDGRIDEVRIYNRALNGTEVVGDLEAPIQTPKQGPIAAWSFDEGLEAGPTVEDVTGDEHEGTIEGVTRTENGHFGGALEFSGEESCVSVPDSESLQLAEGFTLEAWVKASGSPTADPIFFKESEGTYSYAMGIGFEHYGKPQGFADGEELKGSEAIEPGVWTHLAFTYDGSTLRLYVDGEEVESEPVGALDLASNGPLYIGCDGPVYGDHFRGRIDEARIYDRALPASEVSQTMNVGYPMAVTEAGAEAEANDLILNGTTDVAGSETNYYFELGTTTNYGRVIAGDQVESSNETITISQPAVGLSPETTYHYRLVAENSVATVRGSDETATTGKREMSLAEEEELAEAESREELTSEISPLDNAVDAEAEPESSNVFGSFFGMNWTGDLTQMLKESRIKTVEQSGSGVFRFTVEPGEKSLIEETFKAAAADNLMPLPYFGSGGYFTGTKAEHWIAFAEELMSEYGPGGPMNEVVPAVTTWEIWNEPNMPFPKQKEPEREWKVNPAGFGVFFSEMSEALKRAVPDENSNQLTILTPGLYGYRTSINGREPHRTPEQFLKEMGHRDAYEAVSIHPYVFTVGNGANKHAPKDHADLLLVKERIEQAIVKVKFLGKPIWVSELGFPLSTQNKTAFPPVTKPMQAELIKSAFTMFHNQRRQLHLEHALYYNIQDREESGWEQHCGLLMVNGNKRLSAWNEFSRIAHHP